MAASSHEATLALFYIVAAVAMFYFIYNFRRAFSATIGRADSRPIRWWEIIPNALYYGTAQRRVRLKRFRYANIMHGLLAWGFIELFFATSVDFAAARGVWVNVLPNMDTPWFAIMNEFGGLALIAGTIMALLRRHTDRLPAKLPQNSFGGRNSLFGDSGILIVLLLLGVGGFLAEAARIATEIPATGWASFVAMPISKIMIPTIWEYAEPFLWWSHALLALTFIALLPQTKMMHALLVIANAGLTNMEERGNLRPMNIAALMENPDNDPESMFLGAGKVTDFTWKQLLDAEACTECARCSTVCPATATGSPLSPMKIILSIRDGLYAQTMGDRVDKNLIGGLITEDELWGCTTCGACMEVCPVLIDHIPAIVDMRRFLVLSEGQPPADAKPTLEKTVTQGNPWGFPKDDRLKWAEISGLDVPTMDVKKETDVLYWVGCAGSYDPRNMDVSRAMVKIFNAAGVDFAVLGKEESCTGDSARRLGEEYVYETMAGANLQTLNRYKFNRIVTTCPHCFQTLGKDYKQLGGDFNVVHHSDFIADLIADGRLKMDSPISDQIIYHDPCYLGRHNDIYDSPREVIAAALGNGGKLTEAPLSRNESFCCGAGGGNMWYEMKSDNRINLTRFDQLTAKKPNTIATACNFCLIMMDDARKVRGVEEAIQVKDIAELVAETMG